MIPEYENSVEQEDIAPEDQTNALIELDDIIYDLWHQYFKPEQKLSKDQKKSLRDKYNRVARKANDLAGLQRHIILTETTHWQEDAAKPVPKPKVNRELAEKVIEHKKESKPKATKLGTKSIIDQILDHHKAGMANKDIVALGFNKSTVNRQVSEYKKKLNG